MNKYSIVALYALLFCLVSASTDDKSFQPIGSPILAEDAEAVAAFWTPERMKAAKPMDMEPFNVSEICGQIDPNARPGRVHGSSKGKGGDIMNITSVEYPCSFGDGYAPSYTAYPWITIGKVFFIQAGVQRTCSGASINYYGIITSARCVYSVSLSQWSTSFIFVPAYQASSASFMFATFQFWLLSSYVATGSICYDYAFITTCSSGGYTVGYTVGYLGLTWNVGLNQFWTALGYQGSVNYFSVSYLCDPGTCSFGIGSRATSGYEGGPWVLNWPTIGSLYVNGVTSTWDPRIPPQEIYGPYFDTNVFSLYSSAFSIAPTC